ncbi:hypothetical protein [Botrimarina colliarenosi]|nr:hypothetical protein [Botrimarina colliarenosi]
MRSVLQSAAAAAVCLTLANCATAQDESLAWTPSEWFPERVVTFDEAPDIRIHVNEPTNADGRPTRVLVFATPNGNTLEQTLGCAPGGGRHWRYEIQHIAAQTRMLRSMLPGERIVLMVVEANGLSWPQWRATHDGANAIIAEKLAAWRERFGGADAKVTLAAHSGGGSLLWGVIEGSDALPDWLDRIAYLDANYSFDAALHDAKLRAWLDAPGDGRRLIVIAYDDREITFEGKKVVGPTGGTFRATERMHQAFAAAKPLVTATEEPFTRTVGWGGRFRSEVHANPENKILHTRLVGDMNGLVHAPLLGQTPAGWPGLKPPAAYGEWIQPEPY